MLFLEQLLLLPIQLLSLVFALLLFAVQSLWSAAELLVLFLNEASLSWKLLWLSLMAMLWWLMKWLSLRLKL